MKRLIFISFFSLCCVDIIAQSLPAQVIGSGGDNFMKTSGSLEWTLGEIMVETYVQPVGFLTQGFQQPTKVIVTDTESSIEPGFLTYPNPVREILSVEIVQSGTYLLELFNLQGQKMIGEQITVHSSGIIYEVNTEFLRAAMYLLRVTNISSKKIHIKKIEKY